MSSADQWTFEGSLLDDLLPRLRRGADRPLRAGWRDAATVGVRGEGIGEAAA